MSANLRLKDNIDIGRGDMIVGLEKPPHTTQDITPQLSWLSANPLQLNGKQEIKHTIRDTRCVVMVRFIIDSTINTLEKVNGDTNIDMNDIALITIRATAPLFIDAYSKNRLTGSLVLIDEASNETLGAAVINDFTP